MKNYENNVIGESMQDETLAFTPLSCGRGAGGEAGACKRFFLESYGCQMNFSDSEIVASILSKQGYSATTDFNEADLILLNTCSIREHAEQRVRGRLKTFNTLKKKNPKLLVGVLGCMAERLKVNFLEEEKIVDLVVGPDAYRHLPALLEEVKGGQREGVPMGKAVNVLLSLEETYADITPVRLDSNGVTAFISITRGCDNMCSFCVVPFTRGRERSRSPESIVNEAKNLFEQGYREVTLLGQNVDSYLWANGKAKKELHALSPFIEGGMGDVWDGAMNFAQLLEEAAKISPELRIRFSTSNPNDMTDDVLYTIAKHENICKYIHLPVQSGNTTVLERMNRGYTREKYLERISAIRRTIPGCGISTDIITGFCGETEAEFEETISLMEEVRFDFAYMFAYSDRPGTLANKKFKDDVPDEVKKKRLQKVIALQMKHSAEKTKEQIGKVHKVLIEGVSKKSKEKLYGRNSQNTVVVFPRDKGQGARDEGKEFQKGKYVNVLATECTATALIGEVISHS